MKKNIALSIVAVLSCVSITIFSGCGGSSASSSNDSSNTQSSSGSNTITVVDGYIVGATVRDNNDFVLGTTSHGKVSIPVDGNFSYPLHATGGFIDVNNNNTFDAGIDLQLPSYIELLTPRGYVISPLTTLVAMGANVEKLAQVAGIDPNQIYQDPIAQNDVNLEKLNQIAYALIASKTANVFIYKINSVGEGDLPSFGESHQENETNGGLQTFASLAMQSTMQNQTVVDFIAYTVDLQVNNASDVENSLKPFKEEIKPISSGYESASGATNPTGGGSGVFSSAMSSASSSLSSVSSFNSSSASAEVPNFGTISSFSSSSPSMPTDLPNLNPNSSTMNSSSSSNTTSSGQGSSMSTSLPSFHY